jgi:hypothetical protein
VSITPGDFLSTDPVTSFLRDRDPVRPLEAPADAFLRAERNVYLPPAPLPEGEDQRKVLKVAIGIGAAFLVYRALMHRQMPETMPANVRDSSNAAWLAIRPAWLRVAIPAIYQAYNLGATSRVTVDELYALSEGYAETLGSYIHTTSTDALAEGVENQLARGWNERVAWERSKEAFGLDKVQTRSYMTRILGMKTPVGAAAEIVPAASKRAVQEMLLVRSEKIGETEAWQSIQTGRGLSWLYLEKRGLLGGEPMKQWITAEDEMVCPTCRPLHGVTIPLGERFNSNGLEFFAPGVHPNCRCQLRLIQNLPKTVSKAGGRDPSIIDHWSDTEARNEKGQFSLHDTRRKRKPVDFGLDLSPAEQALMGMDLDAPAPASAPDTGFQTPRLPKREPQQAPQRVAVMERVETPTQAPAPVQAPVEAPVASPTSPVLDAEQLARVQAVTGQVSPVINPMDLLKPTAPVIAGPVIAGPVIAGPVISPVIAGPKTASPTTPSPEILQSGEEWNDIGWAVPIVHHPSEIGEFWDGDSAGMRPFNPDNGEAAQDAIADYELRFNRWRDHAKARKDKIQGRVDAANSALKSLRKNEVERLNLLQRRVNAHPELFPTAGVRNYALAYAQLLDERDHDAHADNRYRHEIEQLDQWSVLDTLAEMVSVTDRATIANIAPDIAWGGSVGSAELIDLCEAAGKSDPYFAENGRTQLEITVQEAVWDNQHEYEQIMADFHTSKAKKKLKHGKDEDSELEFPMIEMYEFSPGYISKDGYLTGRYRTLDIDNPRIVTWNSDQVPDALKLNIYSRLTEIQRQVNGPMRLRVRIWTATPDDQYYGGLFNEEPE